MARARSNRTCPLSMLLLFTNVPYTNIHLGNWNLFIEQIAFTIQSFVYYFINPINCYITLPWIVVVVHQCTIRNTPEPIQLLLNPGPGLWQVHTYGRYTVPSIVLFAEYRIRYKSGFFRLIEKTQFINHFNRSWMSLDSQTLLFWAKAAAVTAFSCRSRFEALRGVISCFLLSREFN